MHPLLILLMGMATILGGILGLRLNAFLALVTAAIVVSLLAPGEPAVKIARVAEGFGRTAGTIGIVIALAAIAGQAMLGSGAADRIVRAFIALLGEQRSATALCATGYVLSIPVFFDTVFYLLVPLARSGYARTNRYYLKYLLAIAAGAGATHTLVPPTSGPLAVAGTLGVALGALVLVGLFVALARAGMGVYARQRSASRADLAQLVDTSLMGAGFIILIIAASGAFGVALQATEIGPMIERAFVGNAAAAGVGSGLVFLFLGFGVASLIKVAQGSSTVAMITTAAMLAAMLPANRGTLPFHTVYVATAIASGSLVGTWMNDSGFWLFSKMGGVTELETFKSWTPVLAVVGITSMVTTIVLALLVPLR